MRGRRWRGGLGLLMGFKEEENDGITGAGGERRFVMCLN